MYVAQDSSHGIWIEMTELSYTMIILWFVLTSGKLCSLPAIPSSSLQKQYLFRIKGK